MSKKQNNTETEVEEVTEEVAEEQLEQVEDAQMQQAHPRDVLLQVFEALKAGYVEELVISDCKTPSIYIL